MDLENEREIWRRVRQPGSVTAEEALLPERLELLILEQRSAAAGLRALAGRMQGGERRVFLRMAAENENRGRELSALHYLLTGRRLKLRQTPLPMPKLPEEALRESYFRQQQTARDLRQLGREHPAYGSLFNRLAEEAERHAALIAKALQGRLR